WALTTVHTRSARVASVTKLLPPARVARHPHARRGHGRVVVGVEGGVLGYLAGPSYGVDEDIDQLTAGLRLMPLSTACRRLAVSASTPPTIGSALAVR